MQAPPDEDLRSSSPQPAGRLAAGADRLAAGEPGAVGLRVPGTLAYRHLAIRLVSTACRAALEHDLTVEDDAFTHEVVSAFGEAFNNVALHGYHGVPPGAVHVEVAWDEEKLVVVMTDMGRTFDPDSVSPPDLDAMQEGGMGVFIMRTCMDEVVYQPGPPNVLRLVKLRRPVAAPPASSSRGRATERSAWRMKAIPDQETDERTAEGSRRR